MDAQAPFAVEASPVRSPASTAFLPMVLIVALFFLWGLANNLNDVLIAHFRKLFTLGDFQAGLVQSAFYLGYFCLAIPAALFMRARGYRAAVLTGLGLYGLGALLFWPAAGAQSYPFFLAALFVIAGGLAFLETSANPLIARLGSEETASRRLNLAQAFNPLGSITGVVLGSQLILSGVSVTPAQVAAMEPAARAAWRASEASAVQLPYLVIALVVLGWAVLIRVVRFPAVATEADVDEGVGAFADFRALLGEPRLMLGVAAQFFYVGAQVGVWSFLIRYAQVAVPGTGEHQAAGWLTLSLTLFMIGRFVGTALMGRIAALPLLASFAGIAAILCIVAALFGGTFGIAALIATSFFMSIMFPTIFAESVAGLGARTKSASALLVMAIIGGAVLTALMGYVSDASGSILWAMLVPAGCFLVVLAFALQARARRA
ncbi:FHS family L-fucose permease-like MFS transporter [Sphingomonas naasensis]|uniref:L-fucose:H+ symporter permease n=1 Tax=Sphingomonas naasensis TaxID=1344951 RepID=A0A4S1WV46_9SPHN|nr:L-fucose:H+ symporter permease [Sphingomonas naasensis]NIJ19059.1 FHS family L-fucose permease-like MFS transporter [Sphingomonas naasensis]TGX46257.1 L-fucose:H+ symporter permease [Sphingomonas naasensis]